jgi:hypothetical protein
MTVSIPLIVLALAFAIALILVAYRVGRGPTTDARPRVSAAEVVETDELLRRLGGLDVAEKREEKRMQLIAARAGAAVRKPDGLA